MMPKQNEMEIPLLAVLSQLGGKAPAQSVYSAITKLFPQLTESGRIRGKKPYPAVATNGQTESSGSDNP